MTDREFGELMALMDNLWGGLDEGLEAGYRWLGVPDADYVLAQEIVRDLALGRGRRAKDMPFLPKGPEFMQHLAKATRIRTQVTRAMARLNARIGAAPDQPQLTQGAPNDQRPHG